MNYRHHRAISLDVLDYVSPRVVQALRTASDNLTALGVRHVICGGLAVGAYGYIRATKDVDFLVGDEAFDTGPGGLLMFAPGVPFAVDKIPTDMLAADGENELVARELEDPYDFDGMPLISPEGLIAMKLVAFRRRDQDDIVQLLEAGVTGNGNVVRYLTGCAREDLIERLDELWPPGA